MGTLASARPRMLELPDGFQETDWTCPLDIEHYRSIAPEDVQLRGHFFSLIQNEAKKRKIKLKHDRRYYSFRLYPVFDFFDLVEEAIPQMYPRCSLRTGLRRLGQRAYPSFFGTRTGKLLFGVLNNNPALVFRAAPRGYGVTITRGSARVIEHSKGHVVLAVRGMYTFLDSYHIGLWEGVLAHHNYIGRVGLRVYSEADADAAIVWLPGITTHPTDSPPMGTPGI